jgi:hypothetical protein
MWTGIDALAIVIPIQSGIGLLTTVGHSSAWTIAVAVSIVIVAVAVSALIVVAAGVGTAHMGKA